MFFSPSVYFHATERLPQQNLGLYIELYNRKYALEWNRRIMRGLLALTCHAILHAIHSFICSEEQNAVT